MTKKAKSINPSWAEPLLKYVFAALLFFVPLYPKFPLFNIPGTYVAIRAEDFIIGFLGVLLAVSLFDSKIRRFFLSSLIIRSLLLYWLVGLLSVISGIFLTKTATPHLGLLHWARRIEYTIPFFAGIYLAQNQKNLTFFAKLIIPVSLAVFGYGIAQLYFQAPVISTQNEEFSKGFALTLQPGVNLSSTFAGHYDLATYLVMTLSLAVAFLFVKYHKSLRIPHIFSLFALFWLQLQTGSRIAFIATAIIVPFVLLLSKKAKFIPIVLVIVFIGAINTPSLSGRFGSLVKVLQFQTIQEKVKGVFDSRSGLIKSIYAAEDPAAPAQNADIPLRPIQQDRSTSIRIDVEWPRAFRALTKNPFLGTGYSSISLATDNDYIRSLGETGILGFVAWILVIINIIAALIRGLKNSQAGIQKQYLVGTLGLVFGFLIIATFIDVFESSKPATLFWMYTGLAVGLSNKFKS